MSRIEPVRYPSHGFRPADAQLPIHQLLGFADILDPRETVIVTAIAHALLVHPPRQPFPTVEADLDGKRKPRLDSGAHPAELVINPVVIEEQAFAPTAHQVQFLFLFVALDVEAHAGFDAGHNGDKSVGDPILGCNLSGQLILIRLRGWHVYDGTILDLGGLAGCVFESFRHRLCPNRRTASTRHAYARADPSCHSASRW